MAMTALPRFNSPLAEAIVRRSARYVNCRDRVPRDSRPRQEYRRACGWREKESTMTRRMGFLVPLLSLVALLASPTSAFALTAETKVSVGSPLTPYLPNASNEPALAMDANHPAVLAAGSNDLVDSAPCQGSSCDLTPDIGISGIYFSFDSGTTWTQPTYTGLTGHDCVAEVGDADPPCTAQTGSIGTLPWYAENGLVSDGDPAVAFGPTPGPDGFSWDNGSRLYYANLTSNVSAVRSEQSFKGFEAIAVSRTDDPQAAAASTKTAWMPPVLISKQSSTT